MDSCVPAFFQCARDGNVDNMRRILDQLSPNQIKRRINQHDEDILSPLHYASRYNHINIVKLLVERGASKYTVCYVRPFGKA
jgi:ankyrin repeat protein